jgi:ABC-2 type transport system ATP-binding protein
MTDMAIVSKNVSKRYEKKLALDNFNVSIPANRIVGILGPNGCGKSTFFRTVTGLIQPDHGTVEVIGKSPGWKTNRDIAYLPDRARWYPNHTVEKAFEWAESFLPEFNIESARRLAEFMEMDLDMKVSGMSKGQEARLMLTLCISRNVPLIILDEPFSGIDIVSREQIIEGIIEYLSEREQTILISTHEIHEVEGLFDYTVLMKNGQAIWSGDTEDLRSQYGSMHDVFRTFYKRRLDL